MSTPWPPQSGGPGADVHGTAMPANSALGIPGQGSEVDPLTMQLRDIERQAGVRRTL
jgi:hypothetical protein